MTPAERAAARELIRDLQDACPHPRYIDHHLSPCWRCLTCRAAVALDKADAREAALRDLPREGACITMLPDDETHTLLIAWLRRRMDEIAPRPDEGAERE